MIIVKISLYGLEKENNASIKHDLSAASGVNRELQPVIRVIYYVIYRKLL